MKKGITRSPENAQEMSDTNPEWLLHDGHEALHHEGQTLLGTYRAAGSHHVKHARKTWTETRWTLHHRTLTLILEGQEVYRSLA